MAHESVVEPPGEPVSPGINYAAELNPQQLAAVTAPPGPALVIAGAGSGKTRALTYRVAYLLEQGIPPERILLLTFTNKAAKEMMRRVAELLGRELPALWGGTFHSVGNRILRQRADRLGFGRDFTIMDREDAEHLLAACIEEAGLRGKGLHFPKAEALADILSFALNTQKSIEVILEEQHPDFLVFTSQIAQLQQSFQARKRAANSVDFDDLLVLWLELLQQHSDLREHYQRRFQFILVDEFQDTNKLQSELIDLLAARHHNLVVVGDDSQSIYAWRGANYHNILKFPERYPEAKVYKIETNYRSTPEILRVANRAIAANTMQFSKELVPARRSGPQPVLAACTDGAQQAAFVVQRVLQLREEGIALERMAVLYRSHFHAMELQLELVRSQIPFVITSGIRFFEQAHVKDITAYLRLAHNARDEVAFKRVAQLLSGIGAKGADKIWTNFCKVQSAEPKSQSPEAGLADRLEACEGSVPKKAMDDWRQFVDTMSQLEGLLRSGKQMPPEFDDFVDDVAADPSLSRQLLTQKVHLIGGGAELAGSAVAQEEQEENMEEGPREDVAQMIRLVLEAGYQDYLEENFDNYQSRLETLEQLADFAEQFGSLEHFLSQLALLTNVEAEHQRPAADDEEKLRLSTVHQAKGLEFDVVFVIMLADKLFPSSRAADTPEGLEEERRLFYVAITRARDQLYLSFPLVRSASRWAEVQTHTPSQFLTEIPSGLLEEWDLRHHY